MADLVALSVDELLDYSVRYLREVKLTKTKLRDHMRKLKRIKDSVLYVAERRRYTEEKVNDWLSSLEQTCYELEEMLEDCRYQHLKTESHSHDVVGGCCFKNKKALCLNRDFPQKLEDLDKILNDDQLYNFEQFSKDSPWIEKIVGYSICRLETQQLEGRRHDNDIIVGKLMANKGLGVRTVSIVGVGGVGKTTLARLVYEDNRLKDSFHFRIWLCVSNLDPLNVVRLIIQSIQGGIPGDIDTIRMIDSVNQLKALVSGKRILLVLDDVSTQDFHKWRNLEHVLKLSGSSCRVLLTTQDESIVARKMDHEMHRLGPLSDDDCWLLMRSRIKLDQYSESGIGRKIASKCKGLPLGVMTLGSVLHCKEDWEDDVLKSEMWELELVKHNFFFPHLLICYNELSSLQRRCFSYCAVFNKGVNISVDQVIRKWMAQGYLGSQEDNLELIGKQCFQILSDRCLFKDTIGNINHFKMHHVVHDFAEFTRNHERRNKVTHCRVCSLPSSDYYRAIAYRTLLLNEENYPQSLCECLTSLRVLGFTRSARTKGIPLGIDKLIHLKWLCIDFGVLSKEDVVTICKLYHLQTLLLRSCSLGGIFPTDIGNLCYLRHLDLSKNRELVELPKSLCGLDHLKAVIVEGCISLCRVPLVLKHLVSPKHPNITFLP